MGLNNRANNLFYLFLNKVMHALLNIIKISGVLYIYKSGVKSTITDPNVELGLQVDCVLQVDF